MMNWANFRKYGLQIFPKEPLRRRKVYVFLVCLFCSAVFWLVIQLTQESQATFQVPVGVADLPEGTLLFHQSDSHITYTVRATGSRLLASRFYQPADTFRIGAANLPRITRQGQQVHYATQGAMAARLANHLRADIELVNVWPDTLFVHLMPYMQKKVPVQLDASLSFERRFHQYGPLRLEPDSVLVTGPEGVLDTLEVVFTERKELEAISSNLQFEAFLRNPLEAAGVKLSHSKALVEIPVEEYTEAARELTLKTDCPDGMVLPGNDRLVLFPPRVTVTYLVALRDYDKVDAGDFDVFVECPLGAVRPDRLDVMVESYPSFIIFQHVRPRSVEYLILK
jgi:hypothetical protein